MKTDISKTRYTPLIDNLVHDVGILGAAVFGRVWRYCQMERGYCHAEQGRIADELELSRGKVNECLRELVEKGYLGTTKNTKGRTVIYYDTGKAGKVELPEFTLPEDAQNTELVTATVTEPVTNGYTKKEKKEKKNTTINGVEDVFSFSKNKTLAEKDSLEEQDFLASASEEQKNAYQKIRLFAGVHKSIERANKDNPIEAARSFLLGIAKHGDTVEKREAANNALAELPSPAMPEKLAEEMTIAKDKRTDKKKSRDAELEKEFLERCTCDQDEAYNLLKPLVGVAKAIEKATCDDPITAARDFIEWLSYNGKTYAIRVGADKAMKTWEVETLSEDPDEIYKLSLCSKAYEYLLNYAMDYASQYDKRFEYRADTYKKEIKHQRLAWFIPRNYKLLKFENYLQYKNDLQQFMRQFVAEIYEKDFQEEDAKSELQAANF